MKKGKPERKKGPKKKVWYWTTEHQEAFEQVKQTLSREVILAYPNYGEPFEIYTDASTRQLGAVISQKWPPISFFQPKTE